MCTQGFLSSKACRVMGHGSICFPESHDGLCSLKLTTVPPASCDLLTLWPTGTLASKRWGLCSLPLELGQICNQSMWHALTFKHRDKTDSTCFSWDIHLWKACVRVCDLSALTQWHSLVHTQRPCGEALRLQAEKGACAPITHTDPPPRAHSSSNSTDWRQPRRYPSQHQNRQQSSPKLLTHRNHAIMVSHLAWGGGHFLGTKVRKILLYTGKRRTFFMWWWEMWWCSHVKSST